MKLVFIFQVDLIRKAVLPHFPQVEVNSVDGFQGREKEAILISLVRSNEDGMMRVPFFCLFLKQEKKVSVNSKFNFFLRALFFGVKLFCRAFVL